MSGYMVQYFSTDVLIRGETSSLHKAQTRIQLSMFSGNLFLLLVALVLVPIVVLLFCSRNPFDFFLV